MMNVLKLPWYLHSFDTILTLLQVSHQSSTFEQSHFSSLFPSLKTCPNRIMENVTLGLIIGGILLLAIVGIPVIFWWGCGLER